MANTLRFKRGLVSGIPTAALGEPLFTTDTFDLYIGNGTGNTRFQKYIASGATTQILRGDGSLYTFPLNISSPTNGQVLKYNGTSWVNDSDAGITGSGTTNYLPKFTGATTLGNSLVYDNGASVGIGTATPVSYSSPAQVLNIVSAFTNAEIKLTNSTTGNTSTAGLLIAQYGVDTYLWNGSAGLLAFGTSNTQRARITSTGNFIINNPSTDNGLRFQVTGDGYFSGSVGIGATPLVNSVFRLGKSITGGAVAYSIYAGGSIQNDVTSVAINYYSRPDIAAGTILNTLSHYSIDQGTISGTVTNQYGYVVGSSMTGATNNYGFYGNIASGTGRWNLYMNGTAANFLSGNLAIGTANTTHALDIQPASGTPTFRIARTSGTDFRISSSTTAIGSTIGTYTASPISFFINSATAMTLDASGNLGLGVTPSAWGGSIKSLDISRGSVSATTVEIDISHNAYFDGSWKYIANGFATNYYSANGAYFWRTAASGTAGNAITFTQAMTLFATGNLAVGTTTDAGYKLDVNGTMRVSGASTFGNGTSSNILANSSVVANAQTLILQAATSNNNTILEIRPNGSNTDFTGIYLRDSSAASFGSNLMVIGRGNITMPNSGVSYIGNIISGATNANSFHLGFILSNSSISRFEAMRLFNNGNVLIQSGGTYIDNGYKLDVQGTLGVSGAATFSSSVTAGNLYSTGASNFATSGGNVGIGTTNPTAKLEIQNSPLNDWGLSIFGNTTTGQSYGSIVRAGTNSSDVAFQVNNAANNTIYLRVRGDGNVGINTTSPSYKLDVTGEARVSNAIAIGTTPDTNKPFKILKNINGTVGINFENTSTGSSAFSAIQMGTDVSGGTAFTNLVYSSSGITAAGVYQPSGTSLVNTGSGGLNFLSVSQPIRFFTSSGNGTERVRITNDGDITHYNGTSPSASTTDAYRMYSADVVAGNAAPHFRTENGAIIKLYQETTAVGYSTISIGSGNAVLDDTEFDGYTLRQIVRALRNQGILQ